MICIGIMIMAIGCGKANTNKAYTYSVATGDSVKIQLDTSDNYDISSDLPFQITRFYLSCSLFATSSCAVERSFERLNRP